MTAQENHVLVQRTVQCPFFSAFLCNCAAVSNTTKTGMFRLG